jgi:anti-anti-sigma regulatory factor
MPTEIKQLRDEEGQRTVLLVSGEMFSEDARLLARIAAEAAASTGDSITLDLSDLDLLDSDAAHILRHAADEHRYTIAGTDILLQTAINEAERQA